MSNEQAITNLVGLMTSFHLEIKALPDDLKCVECKSVLKNACQVPCGCQFCRTCIDDVISRGGQFCPGGLQECEATPLSTAVPDYRAIKSILKLIAKCPHYGCLHECPLTDMDGHLRICLPQIVDYPFSLFYSTKSTLAGSKMRKLGCAQGVLLGEEMSEHLLQENRDHGEILIRTVPNISRDMETLKRKLLMKNEQSRPLEYDVKLIKGENKSINDEIKSTKDENKLIKHEVESMKIENILIKREKEVRCDRVRQLSEKLEREIDERRLSDERDSAMVTAVTGAVTSNRDEMKLVRGDIRSIKDQFDRMKCQTESIQLDDWLIEENAAKTDWWTKTSLKFGLAHAFQLASQNSVSRGQLWIWLHIVPGLHDALLEWPFRGNVTVTVAQRDKREVCIRQTLQCEIESPADNQFSSSDSFNFPYTALRGAGVDLRLGLLVSCRIFPLRATDVVSPCVTLSPLSSA